MLNDIALLQDCKNAGLVFTVCPSTSEITSPFLFKLKGHISAIGEQVMCAI